MRKLIRRTFAVFAIFIVGLLALAWWYGRPAPTPEVFAEALSFDQALVRAADQDRPVLVFATADWCPPCQSLKRRGLSDERVAAAIRETMVPVYLDVTRGDDEETSKAAADLNVAGIPALIVLRDGVEIARLVGDRSALELLSWLEQHTPGP